MNKFIGILNPVFLVTLSLFSVYLFLQGFITANATSGVVSGSEFGMLITLVNQAGLLMMWLALFAGWRLTVRPRADAS